MNYTTLRVDAAGVVLYEGHAARLAPAGPRARADFRRFAATAAPGVYAVRAAADGLRVEALAGSRLAGGQPVRFRVSPFAGRRGAFAKPGPPSAYDAVRLPGVATLLTSADGGEIYESCVAAVLGWDGARLVRVPEDRPRVASLAEAAVCSALPWTRAPLRVADALPLVLVNAAAGPCTVQTGRPAVPAELLARMDRAIEGLTRRP
ncbi:MAG: hypothetical protein MUC54_08115 [Chloroflexi bacterium]|nr:hypothetical protein [Chloroflexota bacterium]